MSSATFSPASYGFSFDSNSSAVNSVVSRVQDNQTLVIGIAVALSVLFTVRYLQSPWRKLPPGPRGLPILGNALDLRKKPWIKFMEWKEKYGDVVYVNAAGTPMIVLNTQKAGGDLLDRRAAIYSDRAKNIVAGVLTKNLILLLQNYTPLWRRMRKASHEGLNSPDVEEHIKHGSTDEALILTLGMLENPAEWDEHMRRSSVSLIMSTVYGTPPIARADDPRVQSINAFIERLGHACMPGAYLVEFFPFLRHFPSWLAGWKREAEEWHVKDSAKFEGLFQTAKASVNAGDERMYLTSKIIKDHARYQLTPPETTWLAGQMFAAGSDTTSATLAWGVLGMLANPHTVKAAQAQLDDVVGRSRIPTHADIKNLPYIRAIVREMLRWRPIGPAGLPHAAAVDDWYEGMFIPKGAIIMPHVWAMNHEPAIYGPDYAEFKPERHLDATGEIAPAPPETKEEGHVGYGFGRRICVGRSMANISLLMDTALILWACNLERERDADGNLVPLNLDDWDDEGLVTRPMPFKLGVSSRFPDALHLLREERTLRAQ
ncbi:cytochrome P450 [Auriscalpium vulgare]|uniref:Cytochrome P450 n=1 Tax=Auriscalpium vulgare TaxID=40419 RepID=A0ACB8RX43_9AGAM|nr:cytochrome P450 [Auriscalpium vulgare]